MIVLGLGAPFGHDPAAALVVDGRLVAAAEEERFTRLKHGPGQLPIHAVKFCLAQAKLPPAAIEHVAFPWALSAYERLQWAYVRRNWRVRPDRSFKVLTRGRRSLREITARIQATLAGAGIPPHRPQLHFVEHHLAHASSAYHLSGFEDAAILSLDAGGEMASTLFAVGEQGRIRMLKEFCVPDSLGLFYSTITDYLGFDRNDGEYKVMGMAPYGRPGRVDLTEMIRYDRRGFRVNDDYIWAPRRQRHDVSKWYSRKLVERWGPPRSGDALREPYTHIAAATQRVFEEIAIALTETYLGDAIRRHRRLCLAGGCALNVKLNQRLREQFGAEVFVQPASHDAGTPLGAATFVASAHGERIKLMRHAYWGPTYTNDDIRATLERRGVPFVQQDNIVDAAGRLLANGEPVAWFQGAMEFGPRALGNRSILAHPAIPGMSDRINAAIKYREQWRPFCPSILADKAADVLGSSHPAPFMTTSFTVPEPWRSRIPQVVHVDGTARPQVVTAEANPRFHALIEGFQSRTGLPVVMNTSLNRRGEPMVCSPDDAVTMLLGSDLRYLAIGDYLVKKLS